LPRSRADTTQSSVAPINSVSESVYLTP
jgi:hypothetical protein